MVTAKSMEIRDNFKALCTKAAEGEVVQILRPGKTSLYIINQEKYEKLEHAKRIESYTSYLYGKDKITNLRRLLEISNLNDNWNNNGASAFSSSLIKKVRKILLDVESQPEVFPTACDSIQLEWENDLGEYIEMEVMENEIAVFKIDSDGEEIQWTIPVVTDKINELLRGFYEKSI